MSEKERILVTAALPYANGPLHVGHAIGAYIPADVYARYQRAKGNDIIFICGTDEHGTPIAVTAEQEGIKPQEVVDKYYKLIAKAFSDLGMSFDNFSRTSIKLHHKNSQDFFVQILKNGFIYKKTVERPYCPKCKKFLPDRYVKGTCPHCGSADERGDQCEKCGKQLEPHELKKPYCAICKTKPEQKGTEHWFFKLSAFEEKLKEWVEKNDHWPANARNFALGWIKEGLEDRAITRDLAWGVKVPVEGAEGKVLYVWFDAPIGYISATIEWAQKIKKPDEWKKYWKEECKIVHFLGKDNIPFHTIIWPAMLLAHGKYNLPWQIASNEYLTLEGKKMSTSRKWVLWLQDCIDAFGPDAVRYYLLSISPETSDSDFSLSDFEGRVNSELIGTFGNFINRALTFIQNKNNSIVPEHGEYDNEDRELIKAIENAPEEIGSLIEKNKLVAALGKLLALAQKGNQYFQSREPWKKENKTTLFLCTNLCRTLAILAFPFLPHSSEKIWRILNIPGSVADQPWESAGKLAIKPGHKIGKVEALYKKIEHEQIKVFEQKFLTKREEQKMIKPEDFKRIDLRVGEITDVRDHPRADKLYILKVDLGELGERQLVAGIKRNYKRDALVGKKIIMVVNLKPKEIYGEKSEGMLLAADENGKAILLIPRSAVGIGSKINLGVKVG